MYMKHMLATMALALLAAWPHTAAAYDSAIGTWKVYMSYNDITKVERHGNLVYTLASGSLFCYNKADGSVTAYNTMSGLSDCGISDIAWCDATGELIIIYSNGNIDLLDSKGQVVNIPDYYNKTTSLDKTINSLSIHGQRAYVATNFGVVDINLKNATIADTYVLGQQVYAVCTDGNDIYATTPMGIYKGSRSANLTDKAEWKLITRRGYEFVFWKDGQLLGGKNGQLCAFDARSGEWTTLCNPEYTKARLSGNKIILYGSKTYIYSSPKELTTVDRSMPGLAYDSADGTFWGPDTDGTLANMSIDNGGSVGVKLTGIRPDGPKFNTFGFMKFQNNKLYTCSGAQSSPERTACIQVLESDDHWYIYDDSFASTLSNNYRNAYALAIDPKVSSHLYMAAQSGLYEFKNGKLLRQWNQDNSPLTPALNNSRNYTKVTALTTTPDGKLWCFNSEALGNKASLLELDDTQWTDHGGSDFGDTNGKSFENVRSMFVDSRGLLWFCNNYYVSPYLVCYQPSTGGKKIYRTIVNQDGTAQTTLNGIACAAEDNENNIWVGTDVGPFMLPAANIGTDDETFTQVKIPRNDGTNLADYLLSNVSISCIAVDGGGRKWFGTNGNGVYLISSDNIQQLQHFTKANSHLLSDEVESVAINNATGEVYFGTTNGLCSYMGDATTPAAEMTKDNVYAYPNPVEPDYSGLVTVTGLTLNADVKIVSANGTLVASGRSNGGTFTWDVRDSKGKRVASGVYMVQTATADGGKGTVCRIAVVN